MKIKFLYLQEILYKVYKVYRSMLKYGIHNCLSPQIHDNLIMSKSVWKIFHQN